MAWLLIRIPRAGGELSGVLCVDASPVVARGGTIAGVCDELVAKAPGTKPTLVFPLDGRHLLAGNVLDEATKRGWEFSRHVPPGNEAYLLDRDGEDAGPSLSPAAAAERLQELLTAMGEAWNDSEIGESMGIGRAALSLCLRHFGGWHAYTAMVLSNFFQAAAGTGADANIKEACGLVEHVLAEPRPDAVPGASIAATKLDQLAQRLLQVGELALAQRVIGAAESMR